jgi:hypothetical protein
MGSGWRQDGQGRWYVVDACAQHSSQLWNRAPPESTRSVPSWPNLESFTTPRIYAGSQCLSGAVCQPHPGGPLFPDGTPLPTTTRVVYPPNGMTTLGSADIFTLGGTGDRTPYTTVTGTGPLLVWLCWGSGGPDRVDDSYLSAFMPPAVNGALATADSEYARPIPSTGPAISAISRFVLVPDGADTADYTVQAACAPSVSSFNGQPAWKWPGSTILSPILVTGSDATTSQHEVYFSFLSGIASGVAGGAAIAILQELLDPLSHRRDRRHRAPEGAEQ